MKSTAVLMNAGAAALNVAVYAALHSPVNLYCALFSAVMVAWALTWEE